MRKMMWLLGVVLFAVTNLAGAVELKEGQNYVAYHPARETETRDKIEVTEFFWYGCGHCFHMEPELQKWLKTLPKDVVFRRVPAVFPGRDGNPGQWASGTALYYSLDAMGYGEKLHEDIFSAIHKDRADLFNEKGMIEWLGSKGVDTKVFSATYHSFAVRGKVQRAMQISQAHGLDGVPALIIDGRYRVINGADTFAVADTLIDKVRKERAAKK